MQDDVTGRFTRLAYRSVLAGVVGVMGFAIAPEQAQAQEGAVEEVIVTGTFIRRRDSFDTASPIDIMDSMDIAERGTPNLGEVIRNQTYNQGTFTVTNILANAPQGGATPEANFRGLGSGATLTLLDGRRTASQNLSNLYPQIAIQRVESITDGAAALYGTDAVGGVMNLIPRKNFEGMEVRASFNSATQGDWDETAWSVIGGASTGPTNFVGAFEYRDRESLRFFDRDQYSLGAPSWSTTSWPGNFLVPERDLAGELTGSMLRLPDPGCGVNEDPSATKADGVLARRQGILLLSELPQQIPAIPDSAEMGLCTWEFGENFMYQPEVTTFSGAFFFGHQFTDDLSFDSEFLVTRTESLDTGSPSNPGGRLGALETVPGENPGNPFRAYSMFASIPVVPGTADAWIRGQPLFAAPQLDGSGAVVYDEFGNILPHRDPGTGEVVLADNRFAEVTLDANNQPTNDGGVPFNEDVRMANWRPVGYPFVQPSRSNADGTGKGDGMITGNNFRWVGQVNYDIPDTSWTSYASYTYNMVDVDGPGGRVESLSAINAGLRGDLTIIADPDEPAVTRRAWFNPFASQNIICEDRACTADQQPELIEDPSGATDVDGNPVMIPNPVVNSVQVWDQIARFEPTNTRTTLNIAEAVATGDLFDIPAGPVQAAVGTQWRHTRFAVDEGSASNARDTFIGLGSPDFSERRSVYAVFGELNIPVFDDQNLGFFELNMALRSEFVDDNADADLDSTDFKIAARWEPMDMLALRASFGTSFIAPSLADLFEPTSLGIQNLSDPLTGATAFTARTLGGNPDLQPEEADVYNIGFTANFLNGDLSWMFDYKVFDFQDRIIRPGGQEIVQRDWERFTSSEFFVDPEGDIQAQYGNYYESLSDDEILVSRDPTLGYQIEFVNTDLLNARAMEWRGFDTTVAYRFDSRDLPFIDGDIGRFSTSITATYVESYEYQATADGGTVEGAGQRNNATAAVPATPRWRANLRAGWDFDRHSVVLIGRYTHGLNARGDANEDGEFVDDPFCFDGAATGLSDSQPALGVTNPCRATLPSYTEWDVQYNLNLDGAWGDRATTVTLGLINMFDREPSRLRTLGGLETQLYDPRGRIWYVRLNQEI